MLVSFNRQTGMITEIGQTLDNYNRKTMNISNVVMTKYEEEINQDKYINKKDIYGQDLYTNGTVTSSIINSEVTAVNKKRELIEKIGETTLYKATDVSIEKYNTIKEHLREPFYYIFPENYKKFNIDEVMNEHYKALLEDSDCDYIMADNFSHLTNILINNSEFKSINRREIQLSPGQELKLKSVELLSASNTFKILEINTGVDVKINDMIINGLIKFKSPIYRANISFVNNTKNVVTLDTFALGYTHTIEEAK